MDGGIPLNKKTNARAAGPLPGVRGKLAIAAMALALALAPLGSYASAAAMPAETGPVASDAPASDAVSTVTPPRFVDGETRPEPPVNGDDAADHTMTFYYCEPMGYEDLRPVFCDELIRHPPAEEARGHRSQGRPGA